MTLRAWTTLRSWTTFSLLATRHLLAILSVLGLAATVMGQTGMNFGSRSGGLGNAGGFATGSGFSNSSMSSPNFSASAGRAFSNSGGFPNGSNAIYGRPGVYGGYRGSASYSGALGYGAPSGYSGPAGYTGYETNMSGIVNPSIPSLGMGVGTDALGAGINANELGSGFAGFNGAAGVDIPSLALASAGIGYGLPGVGLPGVTLPLPGMGGATLPDVTGGGGITERSLRTDNGAYGVTRERSLSGSSGVPMATDQALRIEHRITRSGSKEQFRNVKVLMAGRTVVLRGSVGSQSDDRVVQRLISLEPIVDRVVSQLDYPGKGQARAAD